VDANRFDAAIRRLGDPCRRTLLGTGLGGGLAGLLGLANADAKKKRKKKKKKCKVGTKKCGKKCIPLATCCSPCGDLAACVDGACTCLEGGRPCRGGCIPLNDCCDAEECGANATCVAGDCACLSGFKTCQDQCISLSTCCTDALVCGEDLDGGCQCEQDSTGELVCHKDVPEAQVAECDDCPGNTVCVTQSETRRCFKRCGAA
jgi:hypothetical protein